MGKAEPRNVVRMYFRNVIIAMPRINNSVKKGGKSDVTTKKDLDQELSDQVQHSQEDDGAVNGKLRPRQASLDLQALQVDDARQREDVDEAGDGADVSGGKEA